MSENIESTLNEIPTEQASSEPVESSEQEVAASPESEKAEALQEKKDSGEKLTKKEEAQLKEYKLKVNGKERSVRVDTSDEKEMQKYLQKALASDDAFSQAAEIRKAAMQFIDDLKKNPKRVLSDPSMG